MVGFPYTVGLIIHKMVDNYTVSMTTKGLLIFGQNNMRCIFAIYFFDLVETQGS